MVAACALLLAAAGNDLLHVDASREDRDAVLVGTCDLPDGVRFLVEAHYGVVEPGRQLQFGVGSVDHGSFTVRFPLPCDPPFPGTYLFRISPAPDQVVPLPRPVQRELHRYTAEASLAVGTPEEQADAVDRTRRRLQREVESSDAIVEEARAALDGGDRPDWRAEILDLSQRLRTPVEYRLARLDSVSAEAAERMSMVLSDLWAAAEAGDRARFDEIRRAFDLVRQEIGTSLGALPEGGIASILGEIERTLREGPSSADPAAARAALNDEVLRLNREAPGRYADVAALAERGAALFNADEASRPAALEEALAVVRRLRDPLPEEAHDGAGQP